MPGCTCKKHSSQKSEEIREKQRQATKQKWERGIYEDRAEKTAATRAAWTDEKRAEVSRRMSEARKREWAEKGPDRNTKFTPRVGRTSAQEVALTPYLEKYGFYHNSADNDWRTHIGRRVPDFVNLFDRKVFEYFGARYHYPEDEPFLIDYYASKGWECTVLWEHDLFDWLEEHRALVTEEEHQTAWRAALVKCGTREAAERAIQRTVPWGRPSRSHS